MSSEADPYFDPYRSPLPDKQPLHKRDTLTRQERRMLELYFDHRDQPFSLPRLIGRYASGWIIVSVIYAIVFGVFWYVLILRLGVHLEWAVTIATLLFGIFTGAVIRDLNHCQALVRVWPVLNDCFDWRHVEQLLSRADHPEAEIPNTRHPEQS